MGNEVDAIVRDLKTGMFGFRLEMGRGRDGSRVQARRSGFATFHAALAEYRRLCAQRDAGQPKTRMTGTVRALCDGWLQARKQELEPNTLHNYRWLLGLTYPHVGRLRASRLSARAVERMYRALEAEGYSRTTLRTLDLVLSKAFYEETGLSLGTRKPRLSDKLRPVWTLDEARTFLRHVQGDRLYPLWRLLLVSGLRRGELCGLKWTDLNTDMATLKVRRQRMVEGSGSVVREKRPKSDNGIRTVMLDSITLNTLTHERKNARSPYMFTGRTNRPLRPDNVTDRFNKLAAAAGVRAIGPHQVRHLLASTLLDSGYGVHEVAERLGHDAATLMRYYTRVNASRRAQAAGDVAALVTATPWESDRLWWIPQQVRPWKREHASSAMGDDRKTACRRLLT
ncbi:site-specific integrase [Catellatospora sp. IY07-71]|uniref:tyrosine-type recombinase/integrase n=1 Tax=Catellatospora sp. IY07-71 TaxID=2728827 RepID=UPI001BB2F307|nr:site-specific integrase [Catellatospora sp. IY07-71]BCJ75084.1 site-specific integrase [Catellatospora sp. IY07-71]